jgi:spermidine synthase
MAKKHTTQRHAAQHSRLLTPGKALLLTTVTVSGGAVMILELLGTRIIAPYYGASLYVWSALIAVTMIALALGYYLGGYLTDRYPKLRLTHVLMFAALATSVIPFCSATVLHLTNALGMRGGAFCSALLLFGLPLTALAMVGPFVIKLATETLEDVGSTVGAVYAISTVGSVIATLLLGFVLLPWLGTRAIIFSLALILVMMAMVLMWRDRQGFAANKGVMPVIFLGLLSSLLSVKGYANPEKTNATMRVLHQAESIYGWVRVVDNQASGARLLLSDASVLSAMSLSNGQTLLHYQTIIASLPVLRPAASDALLVGLGGGHIARELKAKGLTTDTIEIDPVVAEASLNYFGFKPTGEFIVGDARYEVKKLNKQYDFIIHDCFTGGSEPTHLLTVEMLSDLRRLLKQDGILALNYVGFTRGDGTQAVASVYKTLKSVLPNVKVFITEKTEMTDFIMLASNSEIDLDANSRDQRSQWLTDHQFVLSEEGGLLITDDYNPMESMQLRKAEAYRELFLKRVAPELLLI